MQTTTTNVGDYKDEDFTLKNNEDIDLDELKAFLDDGFKPTQPKHQ